MEGRETRGGRVGRRGERLAGPSEGEERMKTLRFSVSGFRLGPLEVKPRASHGGARERISRECPCEFSALTKDCL